VEESEAPGVLPSRLRFRFGRRGGRAEEKARERRDQGREEGPTAATPADISPLSFWRKGRTRTYREQPMPRRTVGRTLRNIRRLHIPPWAPVVGIILVVFGILGFMFYARETAGAPRVGEHWHATYEIIVCGQRQPNFPTWPSGVGVHTHGDGVIHIHPSTTQGEGAGARLVKWFEYGGGKLTQSEMHMPGTPKDEVYKNGDTCEDGSEAVLQVFVDEDDGAGFQKRDNWNRYIPQDGHQVRIVFGPEEAAGPVEQEDRTVIPESEATRTVELEISDAEGDETTSAFEPPSIELAPGETVKLVVKNTGEISHSVRVAGADGEYDTSDDFVATSAGGSDVIKPGEEGAVVVRFDAEGEFKFKDPTVLPEASGTLVVAGEAPPSPPEETPAAEETPVE
jgi:plastocyanin